MTPKPFVFSSSYLAVVRGIRELQKLAVDGLEESPQADAIRDATDIPWEGLSEAERKRASGLSEDLYSLSEFRTVSLREINPQALARLNDAIEARERGEWDRALEFLRRWSGYLVPALVSYLRGTIWLQAGDAETAVLFFEHACKLDPENGNCVALLLQTLVEIDPMSARRRAEQVLRTPETSGPAVVLQAADIVMFQASRALPGAEAVQQIAKLVPTLEGAFAKIEAGDEGGVNRYSYTLAAFLLGFSHEVLGHPQSAKDYYSRGIRLDPDNDGLLVARGLLQYGHSPQAISDFESAVQSNSSVIWPYFLLAHHYLVGKRFEECLTMCERGSRLSAPPAVKSELAEWIAVCKAELKFPDEIVLATFEHAIRLDPANERARRNLTSMQDATRDWVMRSPAEARALGLAERRYSLAA